MTSRLILNACMAGVACMAFSMMAARAEDAPPIKAAVAAGAIPLRDPYVPPAQRRQALPPAASGAALKIQVAAKLKQRFDAADMSHAGSITVEQAQRSGWNYVAKCFGQIDIQGRGSITFEQIEKFMRSHGAKNL